MRFVFIPAEDNPYDWRLIDSLSAAVKQAGHQVKSLHPVEYTKSNLGRADIVFDVNRSRPGWLSSDTVHVAWVQDFRPGTLPYYSERKRGNDLVYVMAHPDALGLVGKHFNGVLLTGVDERLLGGPLVAPTIDLSICGYVPPPLGLMEFPEVRWPGPLSFGLFCHEEIERMYSPLTGTLRGNEFLEPLREAFISTLNKHYDPLKVEEAWKKIVVAVGYWIIDHPRRLDRVMLAKLALSVSKNCLFMGDNWRKYPEFFSVSEDHTKDETKLLNTYRASRINLHTNSHGFGLHSRVLECMGVGGFIMSHAVGPGAKVGLLSEFFEPNVHFGEFLPETFTNHAQFWLRNGAERLDAVTESRKIIAGKHLWKHRAHQILNDLGLSK